MTRAAIREVLVGLVAHVVKAVPAAHLVDLAERLFAVHGAGRVVGRYGDHGPGLRSHRPADGFRSQPVVLVRAHRDRTAAGHGYGHLVVEVVRSLEDDFVTQVGDGQKRVHKAEIRARRHHDGALRAGGDAVLRPQFD